MSLYDDSIRKVRMYVGDTSEPYGYSSGLINDTLESSVPIINQKTGWSTVLTSGVYSPEPTSFGLEIYSLAAASNIVQGAYAAMSSRGLVIRDGDTMIDLSAASDSLLKNFNALEEKLNKLLNEYLMGYGGEMVY